MVWGDRETETWNLETRSNLTTATTSHERISRGGTLLHSYWTRSWTQNSFPLPRSAPINVYFESTSITISHLDLVTHEIHASIVLGWPFVTPSVARPIYTSTLLNHLTRRTFFKSDRGTHPGGGATRLSIIHSQHYDQGWKRHAQPAQQLAILLVPIYSTSCCCIA
jgi:hypothetical protein